MTSRTRQPPASQGTASTAGRDAGATPAIDFNAIVSGFAASQLAALDNNPMRVFGAQECTCDRDPLGVCAHCGVVLTDRAWNATLADCLRDLPDQRLYRAVFERCADCGGSPDWDGEICHDCRDTRAADAELFARGIV